MISRSLQLLAISINFGDNFASYRSDPSGGIVETDLQNTLSRIKQQVTENKIILYMKGNPEQPQCGFSARAVQCIEACHVPFASVDVIANPEIRQALPQYANWPTFPQLYVQGELIGGADIIAEMYAAGELEPLLKGTE